MQFTTIRWKRWAMLVAGALAVYALLGFWLVPLLITQQIPKIGQTELMRRASVGEVRFNPFTLRLEAADLRLAEADGAPLLGVGRLAVELQWRSVLRRAWSFTEVRITQPSLNLHIAPDGKFNLAQLIETLQRQPSQPAQSAGMPRLVIEQFALEQGKVDMRDEQAGYSNNFAPVNLALSHFSTLPQDADTHTFSAQSAGGGKLLWKGQATLNPIRGSGELSVENASLAPLSVYLKPYTDVRLASGTLQLSLPYNFSYAEGKFDASIAGAKLALRTLALAGTGPGDAPVALDSLELNGIDATLASREVTVAQLHASGGKLRVRRDAKGQIDLLQLLQAPGPQATASASPSTSGNWKLVLKDVLLDQLAVSAVDDTATPPLKLAADKLRLQLQLQAAQVGAGMQVQVTQASFSLADLTLASGTRTPFKLAQLGFDGGSVDLAARRAVLGRVYAQGGQLQLVRDRQGNIDLLALLPRAPGATSNNTTSSKATGTATSAKPGAPSSATPTASKPTPSASAAWSAVAKRVELKQFGADVQDQGTGVQVHVTDLALALDDASSDMKRPVKFDASFTLREGGQFSAQGSVVPEGATVQADVRVRQLALAPLQPLLAQHLKLKIAGGAVSAQGKLSTGAGTARSPALRYAGDFHVAGLVLNELDGDLFASWKDLGADKLSANLNPNLLDIPELRLNQASAKLIFEEDRSLNAARLLVNPGSAPAAPAASAGPTAPPVPPAANPPGQAQEAFPLRIQRLRVQDARLEFSDLSLRPQFSAKIHEFNGVINGLSTDPNSRSQIELDGRVDEFGLARFRGELNPFAPRHNTDVSVVFKNVDLVQTSPYAMKFAGYKIAQGKISLDLQYKVRDSKLEGENQIVIDQLTLGERVDSPDALKLPLELAIALLKDSDGRIDLGLPVSGDIGDPQFSYGALIWKAIGNVLTKIVTAPFRAIGAMLGISGEKLESIDFDAGSDKLLPPEREKLKQVAQLLAKRPQLKLSVPASYSEAADGAAMRVLAVRLEVVRRAGVKLEAGEAPGPVDLGNRAVRVALRELFAERFGKEELDKLMKQAERPAGTGPGPAGASAPSGAGAAAADDKLPLLQRIGKLAQGEPQVADAGPFYGLLLDRLNQAQPLPDGAITRLGTQRAQGIVAALAESGVDATRASVAGGEPITVAAGKQVPLKLGLAAK